MHSIDKTALSRCEFGCIIEPAKYVPDATDIGYDAIPRPLLWTRASLTTMIQRVEEVQDSLRLSSRRLFFVLDVV